MEHPTESEERDALYAQLQSVSGERNTNRSKYITPGFEGESIWDDAEGEKRLVALVDKLREGYGSMSPDKQRELLSRIGCNGCHDMVSALDMVHGMLHEFSIDLRGSLVPDGDATVAKLKEARSFFESALKSKDAAVSPDAVAAEGLLVAEADSDGDNSEEDEARYVTSCMSLENRVEFDDGSYLIAVRDMDSLEMNYATRRFRCHFVKNYGDKHHTTQCGIVST